LTSLVHVEETFVVARPPEVVFDYVTDPKNLSSWQTSNQSVEQLTDGPPGLGSRFRERTKPPLAKAFEQNTEFTDSDRPHRVHVHVVEGPYPVDGDMDLRAPRVTERECASSPGVS
jgi:uncharacterized protein YndB with AHSA1/START domain